MCQSNFSQKIIRKPYAKNIFQTLKSKTKSLTAASFCLLVYCQSALAIGVCSAIDFRAGKTVSTGTGTRHVTLGDINDDGFRDVVAVNNTTVTVLLGDGTGIFLFSTALPVNFTPNQSALEDFNADGVLDIVVAGSSGSFSESPNDVAVLFGRGDGRFDFPFYLNVTGKFDRTGNRRF